ncbi:Uncharacterised protein [Segatella copri]|nr:Uncharacterised protein [Segatella copri]
MFTTLASTHAPTKVGHTDSISSDTIIFMMNFRFLLNLTD